MTGKPEPVEPSIVLQTSDFDLRAAARRLGTAFELCEFATSLTLVGLRHDHPDASERELRRLFIDRLAVERRQKWQTHG
ncbi:MAG: hypothetical protein K2R98_04900 [Gemmataceae bacterium]|nr:hypothetical protein [Gemmataceae bacterium]